MYFARPLGASRAVAVEFRAVMSNCRCFQIRPEDNVATLLDDAEAEVVRVLGQPEAAVLLLVGPVRLGHKIAVREIPAGEPIIKFGVRIGTAVSPIRAGEWVHLHNCRSDYDERSGTLDLTSGAPTDTRYE